MFDKPLKEKMKQIIVVRKDLNMRKGKIAAQVAHAAMMPLTTNKRIDPFPTFLGSNDYDFSTEIDLPTKLWLEDSFKKIVVSVDSEQELLDLIAKAPEHGIRVYKCIDAGLTDVEPDTLTCASFGPAKEEKLDELTGHLKLM